MFSSFIKLAELSLLYQGSLVSSIAIDEEHLVFKLPLDIESVDPQLVPKILSYETNHVFEKKFKEERGSMSVVFLAKKGYDWYRELINCNSLFYNA